jgi:putative Ca2+/H+ antiporter (TMEM165/GDT1 family)
MIDIAIVVTTFALIFPAELPDKTFIATLVLSTRYRHLWVWLGAVAAFGVQVAIAVIAGGLLALLPQRLVLGITFILFAVGAWVLIRGGLESRADEALEEAEEEAEIAGKADRQQPTSAVRIFITTFVILFTAEWGDLSQLLTAGLAARTASPVSVFLGSWGALIAVSGLAVLIGRWLRDRIPIWRIRLVSGALLSALAVWTAVEFVQA